MINTERDIEPRGGARPVPMRLWRPRRRGRTDAQLRAKSCSAKVQERWALGSQTTHNGRSEGNAKSSQP